MGECGSFTARASDPTSHEREHKCGTDACAEKTVYADCSAARWADGRSSDGRVCGSNQAAEQGEKRQVVPLKGMAVNIGARIASRQVPPRRDNDKETGNPETCGRPQRTSSRHVHMPCPRALCNRQVSPQFPPASTRAQHSAPAQC